MILITAIETPQIAMIVLIRFFICIDTYYKEEMENQIYEIFTFSPIKISIGIIRRKENLRKNCQFTTLQNPKEAPNPHKITFNPSDR
jgi:hypothetical protein